MVISKAVVSRSQPTATNVLWARPLEGRLVIYMFNNGRWNPLSNVDDKGTPKTSDDAVLDTEALKKSIEDSVSSSVMENIKETVIKGDVSFSFEDSSDKVDYPDVRI